MGTLKGYDNIYYGRVYDEGVPTGQTAGRIIAELMVGEFNKFTNHYIVNRKIPYAGPFMMRGFFINVYKKYFSSMTERIPTGSNLKNKKSYEISNTLVLEPRDGIEE